MEPALLAQAADAAGSPDVAEVVLFVIFGVVAVGAGVAMVTMRNIVHGALMLVINFAAIAGMYLLLQTPFLSVVQVIVYAGAIMVLFLFVIMLLGVDRDDLLLETKAWHRWGAGLLALAVVGGVGFSLVGPFTGAASRCGDQAAVAQAPAPDAEPDPQAALARATTDDVRCTGLDAALGDQENGSVGFVAQRLFNRYTFPFEVTALLLTVATIAAIVLGRRQDPERDRPDLLAEPTQPVGVGTGDDPSRTASTGPEVA